MDRRHLVLSLAMAGIAGPALAQTAATMPAGQMGKTEMEHARRTAMAGMASLQMADIGRSKASDAMVKQFAQFEHDEQTTIAEILKSMDPSLASAKPDGKAMATVAKLKEEKAGKEFDQAFVAGQIDGHKMLLDIQEDYLKAGKDVHHMAVAKLARGMIKEHLAILEHLRKTVG